MIKGAFLTNFIFRVIDFLVILVVGGYGIKKYLIPVAEKLAKQYALYLKSLETQSIQLRQAAQSITEKIEDQKVAFELIQRKFNAWQKIIDKDHNEQNQFEQKIHQDMLERLQKKIEYLEFEYAAREQLPVLVQTVTDQLEKKYDNDDVQKKYTDELLVFMKERS